MASFNSRLAAVFVSGAVTASLVAGAPAVAGAQSSSGSSLGSSAGTSSKLGPGSSAGDVAKSLSFDLFEALINSPGSSDRSFNSSTTFLEGIGSSKLRLDTVYKDQDDYFPMAVDESITEPKLISRGPDTKLNQDLYGAERVERWVVASPAMKRNVEVEVLPARDQSVAAPMLYMLDGLSGPTTSGWLRNGQMIQALEADDANVTVVMPTQAGGSLYTDWSSYDPKLGIQKWETFLSEELPQVMESTEAGINWNGKKGIGGLSMGASGAIRNAALYPGQWQAAFGISGCYSTMDGASKTLHRMITEPRGGDLENMWGPYGSAEWIRHDLTLNKEALANLKNVRVHLSASDGNITDIDRIPAEESMPFHELPLWAVVEQGMRHCTKKLDAAMQQAGVRADVRYTTGRIHDWPLYRDEFPNAWASIKPALY